MLAPWKESFDKPIVIIAQWCPTLGDSMDCSPPVFSVHGILRQEYWSELSCPSPGDLPDLGIEAGSPALQADSLPVTNIVY